MKNQTVITYLAVRRVYSPVATIIALIAGLFVGGAFTFLYVRATNPIVLQQAGACEVVSGWPAEGAKNIRLGYFRGLDGDFDLDTASLTFQAHVQVDNDMHILAVRVWTVLAGRVTNELNGAPVALQLGGQGSSTVLYLLQTKQEGGEDARLVQLK